MMKLNYDETSHLWSSAMVTSVIIGEIWLYSHLLIIMMKPIYVILVVIMVICNWWFLLLLATLVGRDGTGFTIS